MTIEEIRYRHIYDATAFFLGKAKMPFDENERELLLRRLKTECPYITDQKCVFDESIWLPEHPYLYNDLVRFHFNTRNGVCVFSFAMLLSKGDDQEPFSTPNTFQFPPHDEG